GEWPQSAELPIVGGGAISRPSLSHAVFHPRGATSPDIHLVPSRSTRDDSPPNHSNPRRSRPGVLRQGRLCGGRGARRRENRRSDFVANAHLKLPALGPVFDPLVLTDLEQNGVV